jgi:hypothetical protein
MMNRKNLLSLLTLSAAASPMLTLLYNRDEG